MPPVATVFNLKHITAQSSERIYRAVIDGHTLLRPRGFWADDWQYCVMIHPAGKLYSATFQAMAKIKEFDGDSAMAATTTSSLINQAAQEGYDAVSWPAWDWHTVETVVINPAILTDVREENNLRADKPGTHWPMPGKLDD